MPKYKVDVTSLEGNGQKVTTLTVDTGNSATLPSKQTLVLPLSQEAQAVLPTAQAEALTVGTGKLPLSQAALPTAQATVAKPMTRSAKRLAAATAANSTTRVNDPALLTEDPSTSEFQPVNNNTSEMERNKHNYEILQQQQQQKQKSASTLRSAPARLKSAVPSSSRVEGGGRRTLRKQSKKQSTHRKKRTHRKQRKSQKQRK